MDPLSCPADCDGAQCDEPAASAWGRVRFHLPALLLLLVFVISCLYCASRWSRVTDEAIHAAGGYFRLAPESGLFRGRGESARPATSPAPRR